jgi:hypothetical protein
MPAMNQPGHTTFRCLSPLLLVLAGALGAACGDEPPEAEPGLLLFDRDAYNFGQVRVGESSDEQTFTIRNADADPLDELTARFEPEDAFTLLGTTCRGRLEPGDTCSITVAFAPLQAGLTASALVVEADRAGASAALSGLGAVTVQVVNHLAGSVIVESTPAGIRCGSVCEATFTVPEIVLSAANEVIAIWPERCETTTDGDCALALQGNVVIALEDIIGIQWTFAKGHQTAVVTDAQNNVICTSADSPSLFKLSSAGELLWQNDELIAGLAAAVDAQGNIGFADLNGSVWKLDGAGNVLWSMDREQTGIGDTFHLAFEPSGALYVAGAQGSPEEPVVVLAKLDSDGSLLWSQSAGHGLSSYVRALVVDGSGNAFIAGRARTGTVEEGYNEAFLRKYDGDGNFAWTREDSAGELAVDAAGNLFADTDLGLRKYAPDGRVLWDAYPSDAIRGSSDLAVTPAGDVIAAGTRLTDSDLPMVWAATLDGADGTLRHLIELQGEQPFDGQVTVDGNGDVIFADAGDGFGVRKYDGALFDRLDE